MSTDFEHNLKLSLEKGLEYGREIFRYLGDKNVEIYDVANLTAREVTCSNIKKYKENTFKILVMNRKSYTGCGFAQRFIELDYHHIDSNTFLIFVSSGIEQDDEIICFIAYYLYSKNIKKKKITIYTEDNYTIDRHENYLGPVSYRTLKALIEDREKNRSRFEEIKNLKEISNIEDIANIKSAISFNSFGLDDITSDEKLKLRRERFGLRHKYLKYKQKYLELKNKLNII